MTDRDHLRTPLDVAALRAESIGTGLGWRKLDVVPETGSTNADLLARAAAGADIAGAVLIARPGPDTNGEWLLGVGIAVSVLSAFFSSASVSSSSAATSFCPSSLANSRAAPYPAIS